MPAKKYLTGFICCMALITCTKTDQKEEDNGACGHGYKDASVVYSSGSVFKRYTGPIEIGTVYYLYAGGKVTFFVGVEINNICTKQHLPLVYNAKLKNVAQTLSLNIYGEAQWKIFYEKVPLFASFPDPGAAFSKNWDIGLVQAFADGPGDISAFMNIQFDATGTGPSLNSEDSTFFVNHVESMGVTSHYSAHE